MGFRRLLLFGVIFVTASTAILAADSGESFILPGKAARLSGHIRYDPEKDAIVDWSDVGDTATWDISRIPPGTYVVILEYSGGGANDGGRFNLISGDQKSDEMVKTTNGWLAYKSKQLGEIRVSAENPSLSITGTKIESAHFLMNIKSLTLKLVDAMMVSRPVSSSGSLDQQIAAILGSKSKEMEAARQRARSALQALLQRAVQNNDSEAMARIEKALKEDSADPADAPSDGSGR